MEILTAQCRPVPRARPDLAARPYALHDGPALAPPGHEEHVRAVAVAHVAGRVSQVQGRLWDGLLLQEAPLDGDGHLLDLAEHPDGSSQVQPLGQALGAHAGARHRGCPSSCWGGGLLWAGDLGGVARRVICKVRGDKGRGGSVFRDRHERARGPGADENSCAPCRSTHLGHTFKPQPCTHMGRTFLQAQAAGLARLVVGPHGLGDTEASALPASPRPTPGVCSHGLETSLPWGPESVL